jgi:hypothetical protein
MNKTTSKSDPPNGTRYAESAGISDETSSTTTGNKAQATFAHDLADRFEHFLEGTRFKRTYDQVESFAQQRPMLAVAIGVLAGAIFGRRLIRLVF